MPERLVKRKSLAYGGFVIETLSLAVPWVGFVAHYCLSRESQSSFIFWGSIRLLEPRHLLIASKPERCRGDSSKQRVSSQLAVEYRDVER